MNDSISFIRSSDTKFSSPSLPIEILYRGVFIKRLNSLTFKITTVNMRKLTRGLYFV